MNTEYTQFVATLLKRLAKLNYIKPGEVPNIDLYMDQVTTFMDEHLSDCKRREDDKILTKTMINNYTKNNLLPPPVKKKYSKEHLYVLTFIACMFSTMTNAFRPMTVFGMTDYVYKTTGDQLNGTISAIGGFSYKCGTAISNAILAGVLAATGYIANAIGQEPEAVLIGINSVRFLVPLAASVLYIIFIQFYPEKKMQELAANSEKSN